MRVLLRDANNEDKQQKVTIVYAIGKNVVFTIKIAEQLKELGILGIVAL